MIFDEYSRATVHLTSSGHVRKLESPHARWRLAIQIRVDHVATTMFLFISVGLHGMSTFFPQSLSIEVQYWTSITRHFMAGTGRSSKHVLRGCHNFRRFPAIAPHSANRTLFFFFLIPFPSDTISERLALVVEDSMAAFPSCQPFTSLRSWDGSLICSHTARIASTTQHLPQ